MLRNLHFFRKLRQLVGSGSRNVANCERATAMNVATLMESVDTERPVSVDLYLGTGTAAAKYQLVTHPKGHCDRTSLSV